MIDSTISGRLRSINAGPRDLMVSSRHSTPAPLTFLSSSSFIRNRNLGTTVSLNNFYSSGVYLCTQGIPLTMLGKVP